ncbi:MAG: GDP-mannose 4,6-dehydratase, partial [Patescibacteria group bacterium]
TYFYTYNLPVGISRCTNTYGPGDLNFSRLIPKTMQTVLSGANPEIVSGTAKRDFIYIADAVSAYLTLAANLSRPEVRGQAFNFGSGRVYSAMDVAETILKIANQPELKIDLLPGELRKEIEEQYVSIAKAKELLGWEPQHTLETGLQETYNWYKNYLSQ